MLSNEYINTKECCLLSLPANSIHSFLQKPNSFIVSFAFSSCVDSTFLSAMTCSLSFSDGVDLILVRKLPWVSQVS